MTPQEVIDNANDMSIWDNAVWVNTQQGTFFVPIWRNGNTKFLHIAEQFGYTLENNYDVTGLIGYAFVRQPEKRIVGQIKRDMVKQDSSFEHALNKAKGNKHELDVHLLSQHSFLDQYPLRYCIDLDDIRKTGHAHIDAVLDEFITDDIMYSQVSDQTVSELITPHIIDLYHEDRMPSVGIVGVGNIYASESLFLSKVSPERISKKLSIKNCLDLSNSIKKVSKSRLYLFIFESLK